MESKFVSVVSHADWPDNREPRSRVVVNLNELVAARETSDGGIVMLFGSTAVSVDRVEFARKVMPALGLSSDDMPGRVAYA